MPDSCRSLADAIITGVGEAAPVRKSGRSAEQLALEAIAQAIDNAKLRPADIDAIVIESSLCPQMSPVDRVTVAAGIHDLRRVVHTTPVGAGILAAAAVACELVAGGHATHALTYFAVDWGTNSGGPTEYHAKMSAKKIIEEPAGFVGPPLYFATIAKRYQHVYGLSDGQLSDLLATVALSARENARLHPAAQAREPLDRDIYHSSRFIAEPLHAVDCSLLSDGAVALVVSRADHAAARSPAICLKGWGYAVDPIADMDFYTQSPWLPRLPAASRATQTALSAAAMSIEDVSVYQLYDCFSIAVPLQLEAIGRIPYGHSHRVITEGALSPSGAIPTNTHGGLLSHGYLLGAGHLAEAVRQLKGEAGARQVPGANSAFVGAGPGRQYSALLLGRAQGAGP